MTSLISSTDFWYENIDRSNVNLTIFLDLKKAFDTVDHGILLKKLRAYGKKVLRKFWYQNHEKAKKVSVLGQNNSGIK